MRGIDPVKTVTDEISLVTMSDWRRIGGHGHDWCDSSQVPEVIGKEVSHTDDSFSSGLLGYPQYTRPYDYRGMSLFGSSHERSYENIHSGVSMKAKKPMSVVRTCWKNYEYTIEEAKMLEEIQG